MNRRYFSELEDRHKTVIYGVQLLMAVTFCTDIEYVKRNLLVGLGH